MRVGYAYRADSGLFGMLTHVLYQAFTVQVPRLTDWTGVGAAVDYNLGFGGMDNLLLDRPCLY